MRNLEILICLFNYHYVCLQTHKDSIKTTHAVSVYYTSNLHLAKYMRFLYQILDG